PPARNATAGANSLNFSSCSMPPIRLTLRSRSFSTTIPPMSRTRPRAGWRRSPLAASPSHSRRPMAQSHRGLLLQAGAFGAAPHPRQLQTRTQRTPDGLHQGHQSRASRPHLSLQNRQSSMIPIPTLFWKRGTSSLFANLSAISKQKWKKLDEAAGQRLAATGIGVAFAASLGTLVCPASGALAAQTVQVDVVN